MPLDDYERVTYKRNSLIQVVCQLRFPRILLIEKQPTEFQERIRQQFPLFQVSVEQQQQFSVEIGADDMKPLPRILQSEPINNYRFTSDNQRWHVNLTSTFLSLSTSQYSRWEDFKNKFKEPINALISVYNPPFFERIGLRYVNAFKRSDLNLMDVDWVELIQPFALGFMSNPNIKNDVKSQNMLVELDLGNKAIAQINALKGIPVDTNTGLPTTGGEEAFIIDSDMFMMRTNITELHSSLDYLHDSSRKMVRAIITDKLHTAMEPETIV
jgi:uncharacterized protein (TIGR04255 family)